MTIRIGILGLGMAASATYQAILRDDRFRIGGSFDLDAAVLASFNRDHATKSFADIDSFYRSTDFDVAYVATPHVLHHAHATALLRHGKDVIVEKPMCLSTEHARELADLARSLGRTLMIGHSYGHGPQYRRLRQLLGDGEWGRVHHIQINDHTDFLMRPRALCNEVESAGGEVLWNQFPHILDAARMLGADKITSVDASLSTLGASPSRHGMCAVRLRCDGETSASLFYSGYGRFDSNEFCDWIGEAGEFRPPRGLAQPAYGRDSATLRSQTLSYGGPYWRRQADKMSSFHQNFGVTLISCERADIRLMSHGFRVYSGERIEDVHIPVESPFPGHAAMLDAFVSMRGKSNSTTPFSAEWGVQTVALLEAIFASARAGRPVEMGLT